MFSKPFGARQTREIPQELRTYEAISLIEFIHDAVDPADFCSAAYRPIDGGAQTRVRVGLEAPLMDAELAEVEARAYIQGIVDAGIFEWDRIYRPSQGTFVKISNNWHLNIEFSTGDKPFVVEGENVFPDNYQQVVNQLLGNDPGRGLPAEGE